MTKLELRHELETSYTYKAPRVAGIAYQLRIIYFYGPVHPWSEPKYAMEHSFLTQERHRSILLASSKPMKMDNGKSLHWVLVLESTEETLPLAKEEENIKIQSSQQSVPLMKKILRKIKQKICH